MKKSKTIINLSVIVLILTIVTSLGGLLMKDLYRDNHFLKIVWKSTDFLILVIIVPLFLVSIYFSRNKSIRAYLVLLGLLDFTLYNYGYYLFAVAFNRFFLIYVLLFTLSAVALIIAMINIDINKIANDFKKKIPVKWISGFLIFVSLSLTIVYTMMTIDFIFSGNLPVIIERTEHPTNVVFALDLSLVVPVFAISGIWLWQRKPWGFLLSTISLVKGALYNLVLSFVTLQIANNGYPDAIGELPLWGLFALASMISSILLLRGIKEKQRKHIETTV